MHTLPQSLQIHKANRAKGGTDSKVMDFLLRVPVVKRTSRWSVSKTAGDSAILYYQMDLKALSGHSIHFIEDTFKSVYSILLRKITYKVITS